jgi:putative drug exporter of the RND superfamily
MVAALAILVFAFGSVVAAGLPVLVAIFGVVIGGAIVGIIANFMGMGEVTQIVGSMISVGVGIDYTLLIVSRYRSALARLSLDPPDYVLVVMDMGDALLA